jgi:hypothetical protein
MDLLTIPAAVILILLGIGQLSLSVVGASRCWRKRTNG